MQGFFFKFGRNVALSCTSLAPLPFPLSVIGLPLKKCLVLNTEIVAKKPLFPER